MKTPTTTISLYKILRFLAWDGILCDMGKHTHIELTSEERTELEQLIRTGNAPARTHTRARILLLSDRSQGQKRTDQEGADAVLCRKSTVRTVRRRFLSGGLQAALSDTGWPGAPPKFTGEGEATLGMFACSEPPEGAARWTLRLLADTMGDLHSVDSMSHGTVGEILKQTKSRRGEYRPGALASRLGRMVPRWKTYEMCISDPMTPNARSYAWMRPAKRCMTFPAGGCLSSRVKRCGRTTNTNGVGSPICF
jgi:putative transposase